MRGWCGVFVGGKFMIEGATSHTIPSLTSLRIITTGPVGLSSGALTELYHNPCVERRMTEAKVKRDTSENWRRQ